MQNVRLDANYRHVDEMDSISKLESATININRCYVVTKDLDINLEIRV